MDYRKLAASLAASLAACGAASTASAAVAAPAANTAPTPTPDAATSRLTERFAGWAGSRANAEALISGMRSGSSITLVTNGGDAQSRNLSLAGFTPPRAMSDAQIASALDNARRSLVRLGIQRPNAEQIQAALIGGDVTQPNGTVATVAGQFPSSGMRPASGQVAAR